MKLGYHAVMDYLLLLDEELRRPAQMQPYVSFADPLAARTEFSRAVKISNYFRGVTADKFGINVIDSAISIDAGRTIKIRIYTPRDPTVPSPVIMYLHGGAFVAGDLDTEHDRCLRLARDAHCVVVGVDYRLAPEHPFPAALEDCYTVLRWLASEGESIQADGDRIAVGGSSAGGTLAAAVALLARDRGGPSLALQMLLYPALDDRLRTNSMNRFTATPGWTASDSKHMWDCYLGAISPDSISPYAAPARSGDLRNLPPAYVLTADIDALRDEGINYAVRLLQAGVQTELHHLPGTFHGFDLAAPQAASSQCAFAEQSAAVARAFGIQMPGIRQNHA
jgi:acetyl esterase